MSDFDAFGKVIAELQYKCTYGPEGMYTLWEKKLRLCVKPKPSFIPDKLWAKLVNMVLIQLEQDI